MRTRIWIPTICTKPGRLGDILSSQHLENRDKGFPGKLANHWSRFSERSTSINAVESDGEDT